MTRIKKETEDSAVEGVEREPVKQQVKVNLDYFIVINTLSRSDYYFLKHETRDEAQPMKTEQQWRTLLKAKQ